MSAFCVFAWLLCSSLAAYAASAWCPEQCRCKGTVLDCSSSGISSFQWKLPLQTRELYLQNNQLVAVPYEVLLRTRHLRVLNLANNTITTINATVVGKFLLLDYFQLEGNPFHCSCEIATLVSLMTVMRRDKLGGTSVLSGEEPTCKSPSKFAGKHLSEVNTLLKKSCEATRNLRSVKRGHEGSSDDMMSGSRNRLIVSDNGVPSGSGEIPIQSSSGEIPSGSGLPSGSGSGSGLPSGGGSESGLSSGSGSGENLTGNTSTNESGDVGASSSGVKMEVYVQSFVLRLEDADCVEWQTNSALVDTYKTEIIALMNSHPDCSQACNITTDNIIIQTYCGSVILHVTINISNTTVPKGIDANDLIEYYFNDVISPLNVSSNGNKTITIAGRSYRLTATCTPDTNCTVKIETQTPTTQPSETTMTTGQPWIATTKQPVVAMTTKQPVTTERPLTTVQVKVQAESGSSTVTIAVGVAVPLAVLVAVLLVLLIALHKRSVEQAQPVKANENVHVDNNFWDNTYGSKEAEAMTITESAENGDEESKTKDLSGL